MFICALVRPACMERIYGLPPCRISFQPQTKLGEAQPAHLLLILDEYLESFERNIYFVFRNLHHCYSCDWGGHRCCVALKYRKGVGGLRRTTKLDLAEVEFRSMD